MSFFGFGQSVDIEIILDGMESRKTSELKTDDGKKKYFLYYDGETVSGKVNICLRKPGHRFEHQGIKIEFVGQIELYYERGNPHEFTSLVKQLAGPGEMAHNSSFDFEFNQVEKPYESYSGANARLRYFLRVTVVRRISDIVREMELLVHTLSSYPEMNNSIKMEVGIEDCLHIEFEYNKSKYHLKDVIVGKIYFLLVRIKIKHMEIAIIKKETTGSGPNTYDEKEIIAKYEIMDGAPVRGENIPIRVFLAGYDLTPTMRDINKKFSVRYFLNLVLIDEEERRYFKQHEITLWRKGERVRRPIQQQLMAQQSAMQQLSLNSNEQQPKLTSYPSQDLESPILPPGFHRKQPPSPQHSQSPMQEEFPSSAIHANQNVEKKIEPIPTEKNVESTLNSTKKTVDSALDEQNVEETPNEKNVEQIATEKDVESALPPSLEKKVEPISVKNSETPKMEAMIEDATKYNTDKIENLEPSTKKEIYISQDGKVEPEKESIKDRPVLKKLQDTSLEVKDSILQPHLAPKDDIKNKNLQTESTEVKKDSKILNEKGETKSDINIAEKPIENENLKHENNFDHSSEAKKLSDSSKNETNSELNSAVSNKTFQQGKNTEILESVHKNKVTQSTSKNLQSNKDIRQTILADSPPPLPQESEISDLPSPPSYDDFESTDDICDISEPSKNPVPIAE